MQLTMLREFFKSPRSIGALTSSSSALSREIVSRIPIASASMIVEYGPGTGVFTAEILSRKQPGAGFCAVERNRKLARRFRKRFPDVTLYEDSAENIPALLAEADAPDVDCIISGLPWATFSDPLQSRLLRATLAVLRPGGTFATFAYLSGLMLPAGKRFRQKLRETFPNVQTSRIIWRNLPPAFVYRCTT